MANTRGIETYFSLKIFEQTWLNISSSHFTWNINIYQIANYLLEFHSFQWTDTSFLSSIDMRLYRITHPFISSFTCSSLLWNYFYYSKPKNNYGSKKSWVCHQKLKDRGGVIFFKNRALLVSLELFLRYLISRSKF